MGGFRLSKEERQATEERQREWRKQYYSDPEVKQRQKEYYKEYSKSEYAKADHRISQARYKNTAKGKACDDRYWKKKNSKGSSLPRMASFAIWGESISRALGNSDNDFINRYWEMIDDVSLSLNEEYPLIPLILDMMKRNCKLDEDKKPIQQSKTILLSELFTVLLLDDTKDKRLPADSKVLGKQLKQLKPTFRTLDYEISVTKYNKRDEKYPRGSNIVSIIPIASNGLDQFG